MRVRPRTLWEEGNRPGRQVVLLAALAALGVAAVEVAVRGELGLLLDLAFVAICAAAALGVHPRDFFLVGVLPPLLMLGTVLATGLAAAGAVAEPTDGPVQAAVSGLAHHAAALLAGYAVTLGVLAARQATLQRRRTAAAARRQRATADRP